MRSCSAPCMSPSARARRSAGRFRSQFTSTWWSSRRVSRSGGRPCWIAAASSSTPDVPLAVPNVSEGRDGAVIAETTQAARAAGANVLDVHSDPDHHRSVFTLHAPAGVLAAGVAAMARVAVRRIDLRRQDGLHPRVGALDVAPIVSLDEADRGAACAEALLLGDLLA